MIIGEEAARYYGYRTSMNVAKPGDVSERIPSLLGRDVICRVPTLKICHCESAAGGRGNLVEALTTTTNCPREADGIAALRSQ